MKLPMKGAKKIGRYQDIGIELRPDRDRGDRITASIGFVVASGECHRRMSEVARRPAAHSAASVTSVCSEERRFWRSLRDSNPCYRRERAVS
jgi:hypothetical protein